MTLPGPLPALALSGDADRRLLLLDPTDNCLVACTAIARGTVVRIDNIAVTIPQDISLGHKVARRPMQAGDEVLRYGAVIGTVTADVATGEHLHLHNLKSAYLPTYTREGGASHTVANAAPGPRQ